MVVKEVTVEWIAKGEGQIGIFVCCGRMERTEIDLGTIYLQRRRFLVGTCRVEGAVFVDAFVCMP